VTPLLPVSAPNRGDWPASRLDMLAGWRAPTSTRSTSSGAWPS